MAMYPLFIFSLLMAAWVVFSGLLDVFHLSLGVLSAAFLTWLSSDLWFSNRSQQAAARWRECQRLPGYLVWLLWQVVLANFHVLFLAIHPRGLREVRPSIVRYRTVLRTEFARWVLANSITLTPGTVTIKVDGNDLFVHAISPQAAAGLTPGMEMERRIARVYEPDVLT